MLLEMSFNYFYKEILNHYYGGFSRNSVWWFGSVWAQNTSNSKSCCFLVFTS